MQISAAAARFVIEKYRMRALFAGINELNGNWDNKKNRVGTSIRKNSFPFTCWADFAVFRD